MNTGSIERVLSDIATVQTGPFGSLLHKKNYVKKGTPIVTVEHLGNRRFSTQNLPRVSQHDKERLNKYILEPRDIVFSRVGSVDRCSLVSEEQDGWLFSGRCLRIRPDHNIVDANYLYYYFNQELIKEYIRSIAVGATMPSINTKIMNGIQVQLPLMSDQKNIGNLLAALDDTMEINNKTNRTLEEMAQAIFKSWFVDFEPFQDGEFVESELGLIPAGWMVGTFSDLGRIVAGGTPSKSRAEYFTGGSISWITPKDLSTNKDKFIYNGAVDITELGLAKSSAKLMPEGSVLFSSRAPIGYLAIAGKQLCTNQGFKSIVPKPEIGNAYVYYRLMNDTEAIISVAGGSTFKEISGSGMRNIHCLIPGGDVLRQFQDKCDHIFDIQRCLEVENHKLAELRDTLLPKLMSGEIRVPVEEV